MGIARRSLRETADLERVLGRELPRDLYRELAGGLYQEGRSFVARFRRTLPSKFKSGGRRVGGAFRVYTAGDRLADLELGIFTRWPAAEIYERGGVIRPRRPQGWLVVPVGRRLLTAGGRVRRGLRDRSGRFKPELFEGLRPIRVGRGWLLVRDVEGTAGGRISRRRTPSGKRQAVEPVFLLIKQTRRSAVLEFFSGFDRDGVRMQQLGRRMERALSRAARSRERA